MTVTKKTRAQKRLDYMYKIWEPFELSSQHKVWGGGGWEPHDHLMSTRIFTLILKSKLFKKHKKLQGMWLQPRFGFASHLCTNRLFSHTSISRLVGKKQPFRDPCTLAESNKTETRTKSTCHILLQQLKTKKHTHSRLGRWSHQPLLAGTICQHLWL